jgi:hypothetical protein
MAVELAVESYFAHAVCVCAVLVGVTLYFLERVNRAWTGAFIARVDSSLSSLFSVHRAVALRAKPPRIEGSP